MSTRKGFFTGAEVSDRQPLPMVPRCGLCRLHEGCSSPKMPVSGKGERGVLVVGEAPGRTEDEQGRPFVGESGQRLKDALRKVGVELYRDCWVTNAVICRPPSNKLPPKAVEWCRPNVMNAVNTLRPSTVILLGGAAVQSVIGWLWKEDPGGVSRWAGFRIPDRTLNAWVCPAYHPAHVICQERSDREDALAVIWEQDLHAALALEGRPYRKVPESVKVQCLTDPDAAAEAVRVIRESCLISGRPVAFDYETDRLKPDRKAARIVCCGLSDGLTTVAYPWAGRAVGETSGLLQDARVRKLGHNAKFEDRWTCAVLGHPVAGWAFDGMLGAHALDTRRGTKGLKFQAYAKLGAQSYDEAVKPYLQGDGGGNAPNKIHELPLQTLLKYCGTDAYLEYELSKVLAHELGFDLTGTRE